MGRQLKRVPLDFAAPINETWQGYINPYSQFRRNCPFCDGSGHNPATNQLRDDWYDFANTGRRWCNHITQDEVDALVAEGRLKDFTHRWRDGKWEPTDYYPTAEEINNWESGRGWGHDAINSWICLETRAKRLGVWGNCEYCQGKGELWQGEENEKLAEEWVNIEPPTGDGYQLWENTTEGSPQSPVFSTLEALCEWAAKNATTFGSQKASAQQWYQMLDANFVCHKDGNMVFI